MLDRLNLSCKHSTHSTHTHTLTTPPPPHTPHTPYTNHTHSPPHPLQANQITELSGLTETQLPCLTSLDLHGNKLTSTIGIHLPSLQKLYLASNTLTKLEGLEGLRQLTTLHVRENQITTLDGFAPSMEGLQYLNLRYWFCRLCVCAIVLYYCCRGNAVEVLSELTKLQCLPFLRGLVLAGEPPLTHPHTLTHTPHTHTLTHTLQNAHCVSWMNTEWRYWFSWEDLRDWTKMSTPRTRELMLRRSVWYNKYIERL